MRETEIAKSGWLSKASRNARLQTPTNGWSNIRFSLLLSAGGGRPRGVGDRSGVSSLSMTSALTSVPWPWVHAGPCSHSWLWPSLLDVPPPWVSTSQATCPKMDLSSACLIVLCGHWHSVNICWTTAWINATISGQGRDKVYIFLLFLTNPVLYPVKCNKKDIFLLPFSFTEQNWLCITHHYLFNQSSFLKTSSC